MPNLVIPERDRVLQETTAARDRARELLRGLIEARSGAERAGARLDAMKRVTGRSSMDNAIASAQRMVETLERALADFRCEVGLEDMDLLDDSVRAGGVPAASGV